MIPTLALINGRCYTLDGRVAEAIAICGDKISKVGPTSTIKGLCNSKTKVIDLKGQAVVPGFNDSHLHILLYGLLKQRVDLSGVQSIAEMVARGKKYLNQNLIKPGEWLLGRGWDQNLFHNGCFPTKNDLDQISTEHPILFHRICGHIAVVNSRAFQCLNLTQRLLPEGAIEQDLKCEFTGLFRGVGVRWVSEQIPKPERNFIRHALKKAIDDAVKVGLTSLQTSDLNYCRNIDDLIAIYQELKDEGELKVRINEQVSLSNKKALLEFLERGIKTGDGDLYFKIGPLKLITDGSLGGRTAALFQEYTDDPQNRGILLYSQGELDDLVSTAHQNRMQVFLHAIGDAAMTASINSIAKALQQNPSPARHRINHCQIGNPDLFATMNRLGIIADIQPSFVASEWKMVEERVGNIRAQSSYAWKTMLNSGIHLAGGSDCPVESLNPMQGIYAAITRQDFAGNPIGGWHPEQKMSIEEAVKLFTTGSAYASGEENLKGTLTEGKLADLVVLAEDPFRISTDALKDVEVRLTVVGGQVKYSKA